MTKSAPSQQANMLKVVQLETIALLVEDTLLFRFDHFCLFRLFCLLCSGLVVLFTWFDLLQLALACMGCFDDFLFCDCLCLHSCYSLDGIAAVSMR